MRRLTIAMMCFLGSNAFGEDVEALIRKNTLEFNLAYEKNDLEAYFGCYADDATLWFNSGRVKLEDYKKDWYALKEGGGGVEKASVSDLRVQVGPAGETAIATYVLDVVTRYSSESRVTEQAWETDIWFKQDGTWKIVHVHYTSHEK